MVAGVGAHQVFGRNERFRSCFVAESKSDPLFSASESRLWFHTGRPYRLGDLRRVLHRVFLLSVLNFTNLVMRYLV